MKQYVLAKDIPELGFKEGMQFRTEEYYIVLEQPIMDFMIYDKGIPKALADGIIIEVQEKKWTDSDMIEFAEYSQQKIGSYKEDFELWLKSKEEGK